MLAFELLAMTSQRGGQARVLQDAGMELVRQEADRLRHLDAAPLEPGDFLASVRRCALRETGFERGQRDRQCRKLLTHAIMQLAGNAPALLFLGGYQSPGQVSDMLCALMRHSFAALPRQRVGEDVGEETEPRDQLVGPAALLENRTDGQNTDHRAVLHEGDHGGRPHAEPCEALAVDRGFVGRICGLRDTDDMPLTELGEDPWRLALTDRPRERRNALTDPRMREPGLIGTILQRPDGGPVHPQVLDDALEPRLDLAVYLHGGTGQEQGGEVRKEGLKPQTFGEALLGAAALGTLHQQDSDEPALDEEQTDGRDDVPSVELPEGRLMK